MPRTLLILLTLAACAEEPRNAPPIGAPPQHSEDCDSTGEPYIDPCPAFIGCRDACADAGCRLECADVVVDVDILQCAWDHCRALQDACGNGDPSACAALPACDDDLVETGSTTSTESTGESSSGATTDDTSSSSGESTTEGSTGSSESTSTT